MALWQGLPVRRKTGGRIRSARKKRKFEIGREVLLPQLGKEDHRRIRTRGGNTKVRVLKTNLINVTDPGSGKTTRVEFTSVVENTANPHYVRRNIPTRGAVVATKMGNARITSRPGQSGVVNGLLLPK